MVPTERYTTSMFNFSMSIISTNTNITTYNQKYMIFSIINNISMIYETFWFQLPSIHNKQTMALDNQKK